MIYDIFSHYLNYPCQSLLLKDGGIQMLMKVLERCISAAKSDVKQFPENRNVAKDEFFLLSWCVPVFKSISLISDSRASVQYAGANGRLENVLKSFHLMQLFFLVRR